MFKSERLTKAEMMADLDDTATDVKVIRYNTLRFKMPGGVTVYRHHYTNILAVHPDGAFDINTGGWNSSTTRARLNDYLPSGWRVYTRAGQLFLHNYPGEAYPFRECISVSVDGSVNSDHVPGAAEREKQLIDRYMNKFKREGLPTVAASPGDPWIAYSMVGRYIMLDWLKSEYIHRAMVGLALESAGITNVGIAITLAEIDRNNGEIDKLTLGRIRRYIRKTLGRG